MDKDNSQTSNTPESQSPVTHLWGWAWTEECTCTQTLINSCENMLALKRRVDVVYMLTLKYTLLNNNNTSIIGNSTELD